MWRGIPIHLVYTILPDLYNIYFKNVFSNARLHARYHPDPRVDSPNVPSSTLMIFLLVQKKVADHYCSNIWRIHTTIPP